MAVILSVVNQKGGVGKTTTTVNLSATLAGLGKRVLVVDLDPQGHSTEHLGFAERVSTDKSVLEAIMGTISPKDCVHKTYKQNLFLIPSNLRLGLFNQLPTESNHYKLKEVLDSISGDFDFMLIDCQPSLSLLTLNALIASNQVLMPVQSEFLALDGLSQLIVTFKEVKAKYQPDLNVLGVVLTMYDKRNRLSAEIRKELEKNFGDNLFDTVIPRSVRFAEAPSFGKAICDYSPGSDAARSFEKLAVEILAKLEQ
jgi:chromosome partitioning protein